MKTHGTYYSVPWNATVCYKLNNDFSKITQSLPIERHIVIVADYVTKALACYTKQRVYL